MNDIEREKDINERRNVIENDLRAFDDEDAFTSPMDCDKYENEFSSLLLLCDEEETEEEPHRAGSSNTLLTVTLGLSGRLNGLYNLQSFREREYVRIENLFILELVVWPFGSIVLLRTTPRRGNTRHSTRRLKHDRR